MGSCNSSCVNKLDESFHNTKEGINKRNNGTRGFHVGASVSGREMFAGVSRSEIGERRLERLG